MENTKINLIIKETIENFLKENVFNEEKPNFNVLTITDKLEIKEMKDVLYEMMKLSYSKTEKEGMVNIHSANHLAKSAKLVKLLL